MNVDEQVELLMQGTEYGDDSLRLSMAEELRQRLIEVGQRPLRVYCGYDPRTTDLHLGHTVTMRKLRQFQELGHEVTFLVGSYTALIGDPSDKDKLRPMLTPAQAEYNGKTYAEQAYRILDREKTQVRFNSEWLTELNFSELVRLASNFTLQQFLTRQTFRKRWDKGDAIYLHETFYSIMQGYDAYALQADVQVGGTEQLFNIVTASRKVMEALGQKPNVAIILGILPGTDGVIKMSKSLGNHIPLNSTPEDMYGKMMSIPDIAMPAFARLVTRWTPAEIHTWESDYTSGKVHPRDAKMKLSREVVACIFGDAEADRAENSFVMTFQERKPPEEIPAWCFDDRQSLLDLLICTGLAASRVEGRRLIGQKGIRLDGEVLEHGNEPLPHPGVLQVGKRRFIKIT